MISFFSALSTFPPFRLQGQASKQKHGKGQSTNLLTSRDIVGRLPKVLLVTHFQNLAEIALKSASFALRQDPLWGYFSHLWSLSLNFFCLKALRKKWKMTPLLCACAVVITLETQKCRKRAPRSVEFNFFNNCDRQKRFSQNERRRADQQNVASDFLIFA